MVYLDWRLGKCEYCGPNLAPILAKPQKGRKSKPSPALPAASMKINRILMAALKSAGGYYFLPPPFVSPSETIRPGAVKGPETDPEREHKANPNN